MLKLLLITLFFSVSEISNAHEEEAKYKRAPSFQLVKRTIDTTMAEGSSVLVMNFYLGGKLKSEQVRIGLNQEEFKIKTDTNGRAIKPLTAGNYTLYFYYNSKYEEVISGPTAFASQEIVEVNVYFHMSRGNMTVKKPVIYVYPDEETDVKIQLDVNGKLGFTWPVYHESWDFTATPDGKIKMDGKEYNYLFWESEMPEYALDKNDNKGFLVATDTLLSFLENNLNKMGFTAAESADFITFWYPQMMGNEKNYIHFLFNEACDTYAQLNISPKPDEVYRVGMIWSKTESNFIPDPQVIPRVNRKGFTVIEWGGMESEQFFEQ